MKILFLAVILLVVAVAMAQEDLQEDSAEVRVARSPNRYGHNQYINNNHHGHRNNYGQYGHHGRQPNVYGGHGYQNGYNNFNRQPLGRPYANNGYHGYLG